MRSNEKILSRRKYLTGHATNFDSIFLLSLAKFYCKRVSGKKVKNNNSVHEKLICYDIVSIFLILTSLFHSCAVHPGSYLIAVLLSVYKLNAMACEVVFNYRAV